MEEQFREQKRDMKLICETKKKSSKSRHTNAFYTSFRLLLSFSTFLGTRKVSPTPFGALWGNSLLLPHGSIIRFSLSPHQLAHISRHDRQDGLLRERGKASDVTLHVLPQAESERRTACIQSCLVSFHTGLPTNHERGALRRQNSVSKQRWLKNQTAFLRDTYAIRIRISRRWSSLRKSPE